MKNLTKIPVPKKYHEMIESVYQDCDGYHVELKSGYYVNGFDHGCDIHEDDQLSIKQLLPDIVKCDDDNCEFCYY